MRLTKAVGFSPTSTEADVLRRVSNFIKFAGRYPVAKTADSMQPYEILSVGTVDIRAESSVTSAWTRPNGAVTDVRYRSLTS